MKLEAWGKMHNMLRLKITSEDKKKLGEGSYGSVSKATNISTKVRDFDIEWFALICINMQKHQNNSKNICNLMQFVYRWICTLEYPGHPSSQDHLQIPDEEHRTLQAGCHHGCSVKGTVSFFLLTAWECVLQKLWHIRRLPSWRWWTTPTSSSSMSPSRILGLDGPALHAIHVLFFHSFPILALQQSFPSTDFRLISWRRNIYLVMELCAGGELFDRIIESGHFSEATNPEPLISIRFKDIKHY